MEEVNPFHWPPWFCGNEQRVDMGFAVKAVKELGSSQSLPLEAINETNVAVADVTEAAKTCSQLAE